MRPVGFVSPFPPMKSGVARVASELLKALSKRIDVEPFSEQMGRPVAELRQRVTSLEGVLYQMGNSSAHGLAYEALSVVPGIVELHDLVFHHFYLDRLMTGGDPVAYAAVLRAEHGAAGDRVAPSVRRGLGGGFTYFRLPMRRGIVSRSVGAVVHNEWARRTLRREFPSLPILRVSLPVTPPAAVDGAGFRRRWGLPEEAFVVASLGFGETAKRIDSVIEAVARLAPRLPQLRLLVVGQIAPHVELVEKARALGVADRIVLSGYVEDAEYWHAVAAADAVAVLRFPTKGEASLPLLEAASLGRAVVASDVPEFSDVPDDAVERVAVGRTEVDDLVRVLAALAASAERRREKGRRARAWAEHVGAPDRIAGALIAFVRVLAPLFHARLARMRGNGEIETGVKDGRA